MVVWEVSRGARAGMLLVTLAALGCGSTVRDPGKQLTPAGGSSSVEGGAGPGGGPAQATELRAVPGAIRRLNAAEYKATVTDLLGVAPGSRLPPDGEIGGFDNMAEAQPVPEESVALYLDAAEQLAADVFASAELKARLGSCAMPDSACVTSFVNDVGLRLFRRPLLGAELLPYGQVYVDARSRGETHDGALQQVLVALLTSAQFVFRMEFPSGTPGTEPIGQYELASRLSYLLWSSAPDDALLQAAKSAALTDDAELEAQVARMWDDAKSRRFVENFSGQWLGARRVLAHAVAADVFPEWTPALANSAAQEMYRYFDEFLRNDLDFGDFYTNQTHFVDAPLAKLYGLDLTEPGTQRVTLEGERRGFVGLVGVLSISSLDRRTSPMMRGRFVLENLLCEALPTPPPNVPKLDQTPNDNLTTREYFESLHGIAECGTCHALVDPFGLALDKFDAIGRYRETYPDGRPIDDAVLMRPNPLFPIGLTLDGIAGVAEALAADPRSKSCLVEKLYSYGLGRVPGEADGDNVQLFAQRWASQPLYIKDLVRQLVLAKPFRFRSDGGLP